MHPSLTLLAYIETAHSAAEKKFTGLNALTPGSTWNPTAAQFTELIGVI